MIRMFLALISIQTFVSLTETQCVFCTVESESLNFNYIYLVFIILIGARDGAVSRGTALQDEMSRVRFPMLSLYIFSYIILPAALCPWVRLSL